MRPLRCFSAMSAILLVAQHEIGLDEPQVAERIVLCGRRSRPRSTHVGAEVAQAPAGCAIRTPRLNRSPPSPGAQRRIPDVADARLARPRRCRDRAASGASSREQVLVGPEDVLRAVAVMDVEIDDRDALGAVFLARVERRRWRRWRRCRSPWRARARRGGRTGAPGRRRWRARPVDHARRPRRGRRRRRAARLPRAGATATVSPSSRSGDSTCSSAGAASSSM